MTVHCHLTLPSVWHFSPEFPEEPHGCWWFRWGWCSVQEMVNRLNAHYGLGWREHDLLSRFGSNLGASKRDSSLLLFQYPKAPDLLRCYSQELLTELAGELWTLYVPAGWAKRVCGCMQDGARKVKFEDKILWAADEEGKTVYEF